MKVLILSLIALFGSLTLVSPIKAETLTLKAGEQKTFSAGKLRVRFVAVDSDSRCPINARCIWAGNARVKITVSKGRKAARTFYLNSTLNPQAVTYQGYDISFVDLTPHPGEGKLPPGTPAVVRKGGSKMSNRPAGLTVSITKHN